MNLAFVDTETTGLDPVQHEIWEASLILIDTDTKGINWRQVVWQLPVDLGKADPSALNVGQFYERRWGNTNIWKPREFSESFAKLTHGAHMVGAVPDFDSRRLTDFLKSNGACPGWHYHLICVENLLAGKLGEQPPWNSDELYAKAGINRDNYAKHTAMGDCILNVDVYDFVMGTKYGDKIDREMR